MVFIKTPKSPNTFIRQILLNEKPKLFHAKLTKNGYIIQKSELNSLQELKNSLTVKPYLPDEDEKKIKSFPVYTEDKYSITIPRFYGTHKYGNPIKSFSYDTKTNAIFTGKLRENQIVIVSNFYDKLIKKGGGILVAGCGVGKTTMGLYIGIEKLKEKILVLTHKTFLQDQWMKRVKEFTTAKVGIIRQNKIASSDCDIVIGMIQSISKRDYDNSIFDRFGLVIIDEAHHFASPIFSQALFKCGAKYIMGLTATPNRADKLTKVLHWHVGEVLYRQKKKPNRQVIAKIFKYTSTSPLFVEKLRWSPGGMKANNVGMISNLIEIESRNNHIVNIINKIRKSPERKILILSGRKAHLTELKNRVDKCIKEDEYNDILDKDEIITSFYMGGMKSYERQYAEENADILFGTYDMAHEGLDIDRLNTIILATPKRNIIQAIGRIMRRILKIGDVRPLIIDIVDELSVFGENSQGRARRWQYEENKYKIEKYILHNNKIEGTYENVLSLTNVEEIDNICTDEQFSSSDEEDVFDDIREKKEHKQHIPKPKKQQFKPHFKKIDYDEFAF